jgi:hypothetical protein
MPTLSQFAESSACQVIDMRVGRLVLTFQFCVQAPVSCNYSMLPRVLGDAKGKYSMASTIYRFTCMLTAACS